MFKKGYKKRDTLIREEADNMKFNPDVEPKELNSILWDQEGNLKPEIREKLMEIAQEFIEFLDIDVDIDDIQLTGSMANHNWTDFSDVDLHILFDFDQLDANPKFVRAMMDMKKALWGLRHDISFKDHDVELYAQDTKEDHTSSGVYSLFNNEWVKKPSKNKAKVDSEAVRKKASHIATIIDDLEETKDNDTLINKVDELKEKLRKMRQSGLDKDGEYSVENLAFKVLRNLGYLDKLADMKIDAMDDMLSLKERDMYMSEEAVSKSQQNFFGIVRSLQNGKLKPSQVSKNVRDAAKNMSKKDVLDYAATDTTGLPEKVTEDEEVIPGGLSSGMSPSDFDKEELVKGISHEMEHTTDVKIAKEIAMDHLAEDPKYYSKLENKYSYGCLMSKFNMPTWESNILSKINPEDVYDEGNHGLEKEPHVTVLYGLHDGVDVNDIINKVKGSGMESINAKINGVSLFENEKYDVLKLDVESDQLNQLNSIFRQSFPYTNDYPDYKPHMTIAYLKPGTGKKYVSKFKNPIEINSDQFFYSNPDGYRNHWGKNDDGKTREVEFDTIYTNGNKVHVMSEEINPKSIDYVVDFTQFVCNNLRMKEPVNLFLRHGRDEYIYTTASYIPSENTNHVNCKGRALVDVCRSIAHELTHNKQRELGKFKVGEEVQNIGGEIENEADSAAGMLIKIYTHDNGNSEIYDL